nr:structural maintenance of chromosomes protein 6-like [Nerophis lumbriciformis]
MSKRKRSPLTSAAKRHALVEHDESENDEEGGSELLVQLPNADEVASNSGIVESITLKNFMSHSYLGPIHFGSNVNFVIGRNGSGKSAILTALIVSLGGNAQATSRGTSLKSFVKRGESSADVSITLNNKGMNTYKPELYGSSIIIDMRLTHDGVRTYKLKSEGGQIISTKKEELESILNSFNIQVNNPLSVLNQEMSKSFLHGKGEGEKYRFFMKATQLDQIKDDLIQIKVSRKSTEEKLAKLSEYQKEVKRNYQEQEARYKNLSSINELETELEDLRKQMAWAVIGEMEKELEPIKTKLQTDKRTTEKYDEKVNEWQDKVKQAENKYKQLQEQQDGFKRQVQELLPECSKLKDEAQKHNAVFKSSEIAVHRCQVSLKDLAKDKVQLSSRIHDLQLSINQATGAARRAKAENIQRIQLQLENLNHCISTLTQQIGQYQNACRRVKEEHGKIKQEHAIQQRSLHASEQNLRTMEASRSNRLRRFGEYMPGLLYAIQEAHKCGQFKQKPRGPLGYLIKLKDPEQALAIEVCLKSLLFAFTCDNYDDEKALKGIMAKVMQSGRRPPIITSKFLPRVHDTKRRAVNHPSYPSVFQSLEIEDPVVANCLIDQRGIENILLIKNRAEAHRVMISEKPPPNCNLAFSVEGDMIFTNRSYSSDQTRAKFLTGDVEKEIIHITRELENQRAKALDLQQQMKKMEEDIKQNEGLEKGAHAEMKIANDKVKRYQLELSDLQNMEEPQLEDLKQLEDELQEMTEKISTKKNEWEDERASMSVFKVNYKRAEQEYQQHKENIDSINEEAEGVKEELIKVEQEVNKCMHHKKHYEDKRSGHLQNIRELEETLQSKEQEVQVSITKAQQVCPERLQVTQTARSLDGAMNSVKVKIATRKQVEGDPEQILRELQDTLAKYKDLAEQIRSFILFLKKLDMAIKRRVAFHAELRGFLSAHCKYIFNNMLSERGFTGNINFNHDKETLSISVQPGSMSEGDTVNMRSLSGGERSFSTVCFVLSLWEITDAPFRCLDEFDVYMDMVNRRASMDMMLKAAEAKRNVQFIFLTPLSMSSFPNADLIKIFRLKDPQRGEENADEAQS